ncbi:MAG: hypothetical protein HY288_05475 [Planctomycetia bacterium]|nr:hypothetical protein [Planctomycetia bacterium]
MNCDQVFDILTRGPFPTGTPCDTGVEAHLNSCSECRRLAEALRPALELFQEAVGPDESRDLPGYWCAVATDRKQPVVSFAKDPQPRLAVPRTWAKARLGKNWSALAAWRFAALLALGVMAGSLMSSRGTFDGFSALPPLGGGAAAVPAAPNDDGPRFTLAEHQELATLPAACFRHIPVNAPRYRVPSRQLLAKADLSNLSCCTDCHHANAEGVPKSATAMVSQSCQLCHKD